MDETREAIIAGKGSYYCTPTLQVTYYFTQVGGVQGVPVLGDPQEDPAEVNYDATRGRSHTQTQNNSFNFAVNENPFVEELG